jgi:hypothetical protein
MDDWRLLYGGAWARVRETLRLSRSDGRPIVPVALLIGIGCWVVTLALAYLESGGGGMAVRRVLGDYGVMVRLLLAVPILLLDDYRVDQQISLILPGVLAGGLFAPENREAWEESIRATRRRITSAATLLVIGAIVVFLIVSTLHRPVAGIASSDWMPGSGPAGLSWAGLWYTVVARPIFLFLGILWIWRWISISLFVWKTSRSPLELLPSHPDRMGGLAIFMWIVTAVMSVIFVASAVVSAEVYHEMATQGMSLRSFAPLLIAIPVLAVVVAMGPFLFFTPLLLRLRRRALYLYGVLAAQHSILFEKRWFTRNAPRDELMGASEISSLTDLATAYFVAESIHAVPFGRGTLITLILAAAVPMIPVVLLEVPLKQILSGIAKFLM